MPNPPRVLLLSPYDAMSHQYWRNRLEIALVAQFDAKVTAIALPARYFSWRFRGNSLTLSDKIESSEEPGTELYDLIIATSITDLATLKGLRADLQSIPSILYFHENQFAYPDENFERQTERQITSIYSALAADYLVFNSSFNQRTFLAGARGLLAKMPDGVPPGVVDQLEHKSWVISVPISVSDDSAEFSKAKQNLAADQSYGFTEREDPQRFTIVWNHRWEHDKGLAELKHLIELMLPVIPDFTFHLIGQQFRQSPQEISDIKSLLGEKLGQFGFVESRSAYLGLLATSDVVLSTARHEFQGIAVLEAQLAGCVPIVPDDLAYQEFIPDDCRYQSPEQAVEMLAALYRSSHERPAKSSIAVSEKVSPLFVSSQWVNCIKQLLKR